MLGSGPAIYLHGVCQAYVTDTCCETISCGDPGAVKRLCYVSFLLCLAAPFLSAGGLKREIVIRGCRFPAQLALIVDASGSMSADQKYQLAVHEALRVAEQAGDDGRVRFYTFGPCVQTDPHGWIKLPNADALMEVHAWFNGVAVEGTTDLAAAMDDILTLPTDPLGVIVFTDEAVDDGAGPTGDRIAAANAKRANPAVIGVVGVMPDMMDEGLGPLMAKVTGGGYVRLREKRTMKEGK